MKFLFCVCNGITAVTTENVVADQIRASQIITSLTLGNRGSTDAADVNYTRDLVNALGHMGQPIFTFTDSHPLLKSDVFTGGMFLFERLNAYLKNKNIKLHNSRFHVPFSGVYPDHVATGNQRLINSLRFVTTEDEFEKMFGVSVKELIR